MQVTPAAAPQAGPAANVATSDRDDISSDFETFLKMLTAQIQNQDPLDPMSSENFSTQLATFSGVEQQVKTNDLLATLGTQMNAMGMSQFASWIGLEARAAVPGQFDGVPISVSPNPTPGADSAVLVVHDANGAEVQRQEFAPTTDELQWAGVGDDGTPFESGLYTFTVESYSGEEILAATPAEIYAEIVEAKSLNGTTVLVLEGGAEVDAAGVSALRGG